MPLRHSFMRKCDRTAALLLSLILTLPGPSLFAARPALRDSLQPGTADAAPFSIPAELGKIEEFHTGEPGKTIVVIQDAHDSFDAQKNIVGLIEEFVAHRGVKTVFEEGYEGPVPTDKYFRLITDPALRKKISYFLMDHLRLGGAEYAHINRKKDFALIGADSRRLHLENVKAYQDASRTREAVRRELDDLRSGLVVLAQKSFPPAMKEWMKLEERYDGGTLNLFDYLRRTAELFRKSGGGNDFAEKYPSIRLLLDLERGAKDSAAAQLDPRALFREIHQMREALASNSLSSGRDRRLFEYLSHLRLLRRLNDLELDPAEYAAVRERFASSDTAALAAFAAEATGKSAVLPKRWEAGIRRAVDFYEIAGKRDKEIADRLEAFAADPGGHTALLVFGGFHRRGILGLLKARHFNYAVVTPRIDGLEARHHEYYERLMSGGSYGFETPARVATASRPLSSMERWEAAPGLGPLEISRMVRASDSIRAEDPAGFSRDLGAFLETQGADFMSGAAAMPQPRSEARVLGPAPFRPAEAFRSGAGAEPLEQIVIVADNTGTIAPDYRVPVSGKIRSALETLMRRPRTFLVVNSGDPIAGLVGTTYKPLLDTMTGDELDRIHIVADSSTKRRGFGKNAYDFRLEDWPVAERAAYAQALAGFFYDQLLKRQGLLAERLAGIDDARLMDWKAGTLAKIEALRAAGTWGRVAEEGKQFIFDLLPPELEQKLGRIIVYDVGPKVSLELKDKKLTPPEFAQEIREKIRGVFGDNRPGFYSVAVPGAVDIAKTSKVEGVNDINEKYVFPRLDPEKPVLFVVLGDGDNDIPTFSLRIPEGLNAAVLPVFLRKHPAYSSLLPDHARVAPEENLSGTEAVLEYLVSIAGRPLNQAPELPLLSWQLPPGQPEPSRWEPDELNDEAWAREAGRQAVELIGKWNAASPDERKLYFDENYLRDHVAWNYPEGFTDWLLYVLYDSNFRFRRSAVEINNWGGFALHLPVEDLLAELREPWRLMDKYGAPRLTDPVAYSENRSLMNKRLALFILLGDAAYQLFGNEEDYDGLELDLVPSLDRYAISVRRRLRQELARDLESWNREAGPRTESFAARFRKDPEAVLGNREPMSYLDVLMGEVVRYEMSQAGARHSGRNDSYRWVHRNQIPLVLQQLAVPGLEEAVERTRAAARAAAEKILDMQSGESRSEQRGVPSGDPRRGLPAGDARGSERQLTGTEGSRALDVRVGVRIRPHLLGVSRLLLHAMRTAERAAKQARAEQIDPAEWIKSRRSAEEIPIRQPNAFTEFGHGADGEKVRTPFAGLVVETALKLYELRGPAYPGARDRALIELIHEDRSKAIAEIAKAYVAPFTIYIPLARPFGSAGLGMTALKNLRHALRHERFQYEMAHQNPALFEEALFFASHAVGSSPLFDFFLAEILDRYPELQVNHPDFYHEFWTQLYYPGIALLARDNDENGIILTFMETLNLWIRSALGAKGVRAFEIMDGIRESVEDEVDLDLRALAAAGLAPEFHFEPADLEKLRQMEAVQSAAPRSLDDSPERFGLVNLSGIHSASDLLKTLDREWIPLSSFGGASWPTGTGKIRTREEHIRLVARAMDGLLAGDFPSFRVLDAETRLDEPGFTEIGVEAARLSQRGKKIAILAAALHDYGYFGLPEEAAHQIRGASMARSLLGESGEDPLIIESVAKIIRAHSDLWNAAEKFRDRILGFPFLDETNDRISPWIDTLIASGLLERAEAAAYIRELKTVFAALTAADVHASGNRHLTPENIRKVLAAGDRIFAPALRKYGTEAASGTLDSGLERLSRKDPDVTRILRERLSLTDPSDEDALRDLGEDIDWFLSHEKPYYVSAASPKVSVVMLHYGRKPDETIKALRSLAYQTYQNFEILLVDNASPDDFSAHFAENLERAAAGLPAGLAEILRTRVRLVANTRNLGYTGGNNQAARMALASGSDYVFFLNNDARIEKDAIEKLVAAIDGRPEIGAIQPSLYIYEDPEEISEDGSIAPGARRKILERTQEEFIPALAAKGEAVPVPGAADLYYKEPTMLGTGQLVRSDMLRLSGGFDTRLFMFADESEIGYRYHMTGLKKAMLSGVFLSHAWFESPGNLRSQYLIWRNHMFLRQQFYRRGDFGRRIALSELSRYSFFNPDQTRVMEEFEKKLYSPGTQGTLMFAAVFKGIADGLLGRFTPTRQAGPPERAAIERYKREFVGLKSAPALVKRLYGERDPERTRFMIYALHESRDSIELETDLSPDARRAFGDVLLKYVGRWKEWIVSGKGDLEEIRRQFDFETRTLMASLEARSEIRNGAAAGPAAPHGIAIEQMSLPAALFVSARELVLMKPAEREERFDEMLAFLARHESFDIYIDETDGYSANAVQSAAFAKLTREYAGRVHSGMFDRVRLEKKQIFVLAYFTPGKGTAEEIRGATEKAVLGLRERYGVRKDILPLDYEGPGSLGAFLALLESLKSAELLRQAGAAYASLGSGGRWRVAQDFAASLWNELRASYAIHWSA